MPTLGLLLILNSGTYLSLLDPAAKRAVVLVMALGTLVFPLMLLPVLYYRDLIRPQKDRMKESRLVHQAILLEQSAERIGGIGFLRHGTRDSRQE